MTKRAPLTDESGEVRELTTNDLRHFKLAAEVLPPELYAGLLKMNRRAEVQLARTKKKVVQ